MTPDISRAHAVWRRLTGLFGGDAVERKFGETPPPEWVSMIARVKDHELERGIRRLAYSGKAHVPTLPEFMRLCREVGSDQFPDEMRPDPIQRLTGPKSQMDGWTLMGNQHLVAYLLKRIVNKVALPHGSDPRLVAAITQPLIQAKNTWASMMREAAVEGAIPADHGRRWWAEMMQNAEMVIDDIQRARAA